jgi:hypothetical protein
LTHDCNLCHYRSGGVAEDSAPIQEDPYI